MAATAREFFESLESSIDPARTAGLTKSYLFDVEGAGQWKVDVNDGALAVSEGGDGADVTISISEENFLKINRGELQPANAFMTGQLKVKGDVSAAMQLDKIL
jgi:putative sterol carrier protein